MNNHDEQKAAKTEKGGNGADERKRTTLRYFRFGAMILTSTIVMFILTYTNSYVLSHVRWSEERTYGRCSWELPWP